MAGIRRLAASTSLDRTRRWWTATIPRPSALC